MALYHDAASILSSKPPLEGSFRSRIYENKSLKSPPGLVYRLITECANWDVLLSEVIETAGILSHEPKLTPLLSLLLVHDHLLSKRGIACPQNHPLRVAIERHKARLRSEFTKARLRRQCPTQDALLAHVLAEKSISRKNGGRPRWIRINHLKGSFENDLKLAFPSIREVPTLDQIANSDATASIFVRDQNVPDLLATSLSAKQITTSDVYRSGKIILQDKASCYPAHLLLNSSPLIRPNDANARCGDVLDACAAPGNKTTHAASILGLNSMLDTGPVSPKRSIFACERDAKRSETLQSMIDSAGASSIVKLLAKSDFLALDPKDERFRNTTHVLLDPSCSGSGIIGREDIPVLVLPKDPRRRESHESKSSSKNDGNRANKRKRPSPHLSTKGGRPQKTLQKDTTNAPPLPDMTASKYSDNSARLQKLSNLQTQFLEHAFTFPNAKVVTYSTCSVHVVENENVALSALSSPIARKRGWRVLRREEQPEGLRSWPHRGHGLAILDDDEGEQQDGANKTGASEVPALHGNSHTTNVAMKMIKHTGNHDEFINACIRCEPGCGHGTIGFFVVGFVRDGGMADCGGVGGEGEVDEKEGEEGEEWKGF